MDGGKTLLDKGYIMIMKNLIKLEILQKNNDLSHLLIKFNNKNYLHREILINEIIGEETEISKKIIYGEIPMSGNCIISLSRISHTIESMTTSNGVIYGWIRILDTPSGIKLKNVIQHCGVKLIPRICGSEIITFDIDYDTN